MVNYKGNGFLKILYNFGDKKCCGWKSFLTTTFHDTDLLEFLIEKHRPNYNTNISVLFIMEPWTILWLSSGDWTVFLMCALFRLHILWAASFVFLMMTYVDFAFKDAFNDLLVSKSEVLYAHAKQASSSSSSL